jgi:hypothetical protein
MITLSPFDLPFLAIGDEWASRVVANGGAMPSGNTLRAVATFRTSIASIRSQIVLCNFFAPDSIVAALTPLIVGPGPGLWPTVNPGFDGRKGLDGWGLNSTGDPQLTNIFTPSTSGLSFTNMGFVLYCFAWNDGADKQDFGAYKTATNDGFYIENASGARDVQIGRVLVSVAGTGLNGYYSGQRRSTTDFNFYFANSTNAHASIGSSATVETGVISNLNFPATVGLSIDGALSVKFPTFRTYSFLAVTTGMSAADSAALYTAVQALRTSLGGGFV